MTAVHTEATGCNGGFQAELQRVVAALGGAAVIAGLGIAVRVGVGVRLVTAGPHRGFDRLEVRAGLRVEQSGQPRHAVGPLPAKMPPAAAGPVVVAEQAVGVEVVGDALTQCGHDPCVDPGCVLDQLALGGRRVGG